MSADAVISPDHARCIARPSWWFGALALGPAFGMLTAGRGWLALPFLLEPVAFLAAVTDLSSQVIMSDASRDPWTTLAGVTSLAHLTFGLTCFLMIAHVFVCIPLASVELVFRRAPERWYSKPWRAIGLAWILPIVMGAVLLSLFQVVKVFDVNMRPGIDRYGLVLMRTLPCVSVLNVPGCGLRQGDVIAFKEKKYGSTRLSRIVGLAGYTVELRNGTLIVNGIEAVRTVGVRRFVREKCIDCENERRSQYWEVEIQEQLPNGPRILALNRETTPDKLSAPLVTVPVGHVALLDDYRNADWYADAPPKIIILPEQELQARAVVTLLRSS